MKARIGLVGDHPATILGLTSILNAHPTLHVVAAAATASDLVESDTRFDAIVLDLHLEDGSTPQSNVALLVSTGAPVLVYANGEPQRLLTEVALAGAAGLVRKAESAAGIVRAVVAATRGERFTPLEWTRAAGGRPHRGPRLTKREADVLTRYAMGETAEMVGAALFVTRETVHDHIRRIRSKYNAAGRPAPTKVDLFRRAVEDGFFDSTGYPTS